MAGIDAKLADFARKNDEFRLAGEDRLLGTDYIDVEGGVGHGTMLYLRVFAFSNASSIGPTM